MKKNIKTIGLSLAGLSLLATGVVALTTQAAEPSDNGNGDGEQRHEKRGEHKEKFTAVKEAVENNDYDAWLEAISGHPKMEDMATEENFNTMVQAHELMEAGDKEGAKALLEEAGIKHPGKMKHQGQRGERFQDVRNAVEAGDYQAWADVMAEHPNAEVEINEATFATLQEAHELMEAGDKEGAKALLKEAGIDHGKRGQGKHDSGQRGSHDKDERA